MKPINEVQYLLKQIAEYRAELKELAEKAKPRKRGCIAARKREIIVYKLLRMTEQDLADAN